MDEDEDLCVARVLHQRADDAHVRGQVALDVAALRVEDVDEHADVAEDVRPLLAEEVLDEGLLPAAVPQVQREVA